MYYLLLARGPASSGGISYHEREKTVSARSVKLSETGAVGASKGDTVHSSVSCCTAPINLCVWFLWFWIRHAGQTSRDIYGDCLDAGRIVWNVGGSLLQTHLGGQADWWQRSLVCGKFYLPYKCLIDAWICLFVYGSITGFWWWWRGRWRSSLSFSFLWNWEAGLRFRRRKILTQSLDSSLLYWLSFNRL